MSSPGDDKDLEDLLAGRSDVSRRYRAAKSADPLEEPPADLDRAILAKARAAVELPPATGSSLPPRHRIRWAVPFALAASVLLTFAIYREGSDKVGVNGDVTTGAVTEQAAAPLSAPVVVAAAPEEAQADRAEEEVVTRDDVAQKAVESRAAAPIAAAAPPETVVQTASPTAETSIEPVASGNVSIASVAVPPAPPPPPAARPSAAPAATAPAAQRASAEVARGEADAAKAERTPAAWLEEVRRLRAAEQGAAADEELKRFLEAYPDYFTKNPGIARP